MKTLEELTSGGCRRPVADLCTVGDRPGSKTRFAVSRLKSDRSALSSVQDRRKGACYAEPNDETTSTKPHTGTAKPQISQFFPQTAKAGLQDHRRLPARQPL
jgi:hypothetical protein